MDNSIYTNECKFCSAKISDKTKSGKQRKFCDKSCARKYTCKNNIDTVKEANKKGYQTLLQRSDAKDFLKYRGRSTELKRRKDIVRYDISKHSREGGLTHSNPEVSEKRRNSMIRKGLWLDHNTFDFKEFKRYRQSIHRLTKKLYGPAGNGYQWDHVFPILWGYKCNIPVNIMCSEENVEKMIDIENTKKGSRLTQKAIFLYENWIARGALSGSWEDVWAK